MLFVCKYNTFALCTLQLTNLLFAVFVYLEAYRVVIVYDRRSARFWMSFGSSVFGCLYSSENIIRLDVVWEFCLRLFCLPKQVETRTTSKRR